MEHQWERYYVASKETAHRYGPAAAALYKEARPEPDTTVRDLALIHSTLGVKAGRKKKQPTPTQPTLF
jgi:hypothetical protein